MNKAVGETFEAEFAILATEATFREACQSYERCLNLCVEAHSEAQHAQGTMLSRALAAIKAIMRARWPDASETYFEKED
jgi:hypothetical protein